MPNENEMKLAQATYDAMCKALDKRDWHYDKLPDDLVIKSGVRGEDLPIEFFIRMIPSNQLVQLISMMPFRVNEDVRADMARVVCIANNGMIDGSFDFDIESGAIVFRLTSSYRGSLLGDELFEYMIMVSASTIDRYNDRFLTVAKGIWSVDEFLADEKKRREG